MSAATKDNTEFMTPSGFALIEYFKIKVQSYKRPIFHNLVFTSSGLPLKDKIEIEKLIHQNGGKYNAKFMSKKTDILISQSNRTDSEKFKGALKCGKECLTSDWVTESVAKGYALPFINYRIYCQPQYNNCARLLQTDATCLNGLRIVFSIYRSAELDFLVNLARRLGCKISDRYIRVENPILVCPLPEGEKYDAAIKWNFPVVSADWLLKCGELKKLVPFKEYLVGEAKCQADHIQNSLENERNINDNTNMHKTYQNNIDGNNDKSSRNSISNLCEADENVIDLSLAKENTDQQAALKSKLLSNERSIITKCFSISLSADVEYLRKSILTLNGTVCADLAGYDPSCTHLICSYPNRSEKILSAIAAGNWLLCVDYIEDSFNAGYFLSEEDYEWGNPKAESKLATFRDDEPNNLAVLSHNWRSKLQLMSKQLNKRVGIFSNFCVLLHVHTSRKANFKKLVEAGCGVVVDIKKPYHDHFDIVKVTHCIIDDRIEKMSNDDRLALENAGVYCVNILYLQACIQSIDYLPLVKDFLVE